MVAKFPQRAMASCCTFAGARVWGPASVVSAVVRQLPASGFATVVKAAAQRRAVLHSHSFTQGNTAPGLQTKHAQTVPHLVNQAQSADNIGWSWTKVAPLCFLSSALTTTNKDSCSPNCRNVTAGASRVAKHLPPPPSTASAAGLSLSCAMLPPHPRSDTSATRRGHMKSAGRRAMSSGKSKLHKEPSTFMRWIYTIVVVIAGVAILGLLLTVGFLALGFILALSIFLWVLYKARNSRIVQYFWNNTSAGRALAQKMQEAEQRRVGDQMAHSQHGPGEMPNPVIGSVLKAIFPFIRGAMTAAEERSRELMAEMELVKAQVSDLMQNNKDVVNNLGSDFVMEIEDADFEGEVDKLDIDAVMSVVGSRGTGILRVKVLIGEETELQSAVLTLANGKEVHLFKGAKVTVDI